MAAFVGDNLNLPRNVMVHFPRKNTNDIICKLIDAGQQPDAVLKSWHHATASDFTFRDSLNRRSRKQIAPRIFLKASMQFGATYYWIARTPCRWVMEPLACHL